MVEYVSCPRCSGTICTQEYIKKYSQCRACYMPLNVKLARL